MVVAKPRKKKTNPRIVPKKRRTKLEIRRSNAAKKGWQTRRIQKLADTKFALEHVQAVKKLSRKDLENLALRQQKELTEKWVHLADDDMLHEDGTLAVESSRARHQKYTARLYKTLKKLQKQGEMTLARGIREIAGDLDLPVQELYTLLFSP